ncbi:ergothioneine biosynthesis protein EgtB [Mariniflexile ostreae]|uniref:Ergothioneine biosynthesis protein EgtB n=1 Tax=Mariniflexile ostreae TaxID=1520892 RepID=A0ABV5FEN6_9FLAO
MTVLKDYLDTRHYTEQLCKHLQPEDYTPQSACFASPPKWHIAHTTWFFEEMILKVYVPGYTVFDASFGYLFNSYYNSLGERIKRENRGLITRPNHKRIFEYRAHVDAKIVSLLNEEVSDKILKMIVLGINHEQQHQELLLTDLKYTFSHNPTYPKFWETTLVEQDNEAPGWIPIEAGIYAIGHDSKAFCYDNELSKHRVFLEPFEISEHLVSNASYMDFINDGGYENPAYWLDQGWQWIQQENIKKPLYWKGIKGSWHQYTLSGLKPLDPKHPIAHVSFYEAAAFAQWAGYRLPTEFEWEVASHQLQWGKRWEWTNSAYLPYPNFKIAEGAAGEYNGKFMINQMVLRGASTATSKNHSRPTYRNFFPAETQWQVTGIRLAK